MLINVFMFATLRGGKMDARDCQNMCVCTHAHCSPAHKLAGDGPQFSTHLPDFFCITEVGYFR